MVWWKLVVGRFSLWDNIYSFRSQCWFGLGGPVVDGWEGYKGNVCLEVMFWVKASSLLAELGSSKVTLTYHSWLESLGYHMAWTTLAGCIFAFIWRLFKVSLQNQDSKNIVHTKHTIHYTISSPFHKKYKYCHCTQCICPFYCVNLVQLKVDINKNFILIEWNSDVFTLPITCPPGLKASPPTPL